MKKYKGWISLVLFFVLLALILFGGPILSKKVDEAYRKNIDKNGAFSRAFIFQKKTHKGRTAWGNI